jgi:hypothetical protein
MRAPPLTWRQLLFLAVYGPPRQDLPPPEEFAKLSSVESTRKLSLGTGRHRPVRFRGSQSPSLARREVRSLALKELDHSLRELTQIERSRS